MGNWFAKKEETAEKQFVHSSLLPTEQRGAYAEQALNNPVIIEAFRDIDDRLTKEWRNTLDDLVDQREIAYHRLKALEYIKQALTGYMNETLLEREMKKQQEDEQWMQKQS